MDMSQRPRDPFSPGGLQQKLFKERKLRGIARRRNRLGFIPYFHNYRLLCACATAACASFTAGYSFRHIFEIN
jgi:hypothetical protein